MQYYRCKCGNAQMWGSIPPNRCSGCRECNTSLETNPNFHTTPEPHDFSYVEDVETDEGNKPLTRCKYCYRSRKELGL